MKEIEFRVWQGVYGTGSKKYKADTVSRLKKLERDLKNCNLDKEYKKDKGASLLELFKDKGKQLEKREHGTLPVGEYQLASYKQAVKEYFKFKETEK